MTKIVTSPHETLGYENKPVVVKPTTPGVKKVPAKMVKFTPGGEGPRHAGKVWNKTRPHRPVESKASSEPTVAPVKDAPHSTGPGYDDARGFTRLGETGLRERGYTATKIKTKDM